MVAAAIATQVKVVLVLLGIHPQLLDALLKHVQSLLALRAADDLPNAGYQAVCCGNGLAIVVQAHVERLDVARVVGHERGALEVLLGEVALVLGLEVDAPGDRVLEHRAGVLGVLEDLHGVGVAHAREVAGGNVDETVLEALVHPLVEEVQFVGAVLHHVGDDVLEHLLRDVHLALEVAEGHLGLDHPELGRMTARVGVLGAEGGSKGVYVTKAHGEVLGLELAGHREVGRLAKEVLAVVDLAVVGKRRVCGVDGGHAEHLARALGVRSGDDWRVHVDEAALLEEAVDDEGRHAAHAKDRAEEVGAAAQVLLGAEELAGLTLLLHGVVRRGGALDRDGLRLQLEGLRAVRRKLERTAHDERRTHVLRDDSLVGLVSKALAIDNDLQVLEAAAVVQGDKAKVLHVADGAHPARHGKLGATQLVHVRVERGYSRAVQRTSFLLEMCHAR